MAPIEPQDLPVGLPGGLTCRPLAAGDIAGALALSAAAGWNQNAADWRYMIGRGPGWACCDGQGRLVATALTLPCGRRFGWIGMVLVTAAWQRRGIAGRLLEAAVAALVERGVTPGLDATEAGRGVYLPLGFRDVYPLSRYRAERPVCPAGEAAQDMTEAVRPLQPGDLAAVAEYDRAAFGGDRRDLLAALLARAPGLAGIAPGGRGHALGRDGRIASQLGPIVAGDTATAMALAGHALRRAGGPVYIDVPDRHEDFRAWLEAAGFRRQRGFMRMLHGRGEPFDDPARVFAIAGPELG